MPSGMQGGTQSDTLVKDVAQTIQSELFPALTRLLESYGQIGQKQQEQQGESATQDWAQPAFQVKQATDRIVQQFQRGAIGTDEIEEIQLPRSIRQQPGGEQYGG